jgi:ADP-ribose pyrophosphatase YjhB (NUDIX family)
VVGDGLVRCAGAIIFDEAGRLLLVQRRNDPSRGLWCEPSGRCEDGETAAQACVREAREETGLEVRVTGRVGSVMFDGYLIEDFRCEVVGGTPAAGDDAQDLRWVSRSELAALPLVADLKEILTGWDCLPRV